MILESTNSSINCINFAFSFLVAVAGGGRTSKVRIVRMRFVSFMDSTGVHNLSNLLKICKMNRVHLVLSGVNKEVLHTLLSSGLLDSIGRENVLPNIHLALQRSREILEAEG